MQKAASLLAQISCLRRRTALLMTETELMLTGFDALAHGAVSDIGIRLMLVSGLAYYLRTGGKY